jgi:very-short-patch-repair endonuclease
VDPGSVIARLGGVARTRELEAHGCTRRAITAAVVCGDVVRLRVGWFGLPSLAAPVIQAHRAGGAPACATVASIHGLWMLHQPGLHIEVSRGGTRALAPPGVTVHWVPDCQRSPRQGQELGAALRTMTACLPELDAVCAIDSALNRGLVRLDELRHGASPACLRVLDRCDGRAESGTESVFRVRAEDAGFRFATQVALPGSRADFLFGDRLIVEVDGSEHHAGREAFVADRERDAWHAALGFRVVRLTYGQVVHRWHEVESLLRLMLARGEHRARERIRNHG